MKLMIRDEYYKLIKAGKKIVDYRDAHITFVNEDTGEKMTRKVVGVKLMSHKKLPDDLKDSLLFGDDKIIAFELEQVKTK